MRLWLNQTIVLPDGKVRRGVFDDYTHEVPPARAFRFDTDTTAGENPQSFNPWANDVKLIDIDGDGDLDFITLGLGRLDRFTPASAVELTYINRLVSEGFQHLTRRNEEIVVYNPTVIGVAPNGSARGMLRQVTVKGLNFDKDVQFSFGEGIDVLEVINVNPHGNQAEVMIYVHENAQLGPRRVVVQNGRAGGATMTKPGAFTVYETLADANRNNVREDNWTLYE